MYAVIRSGGKQYKVTKGEHLRLDSFAAEEGAEVSFEVLAFHNGETLTLGTPIVESAKVTATVVGHGRGRKIIVYRFKRRKGYHRKKGHRQDYTEVMIQDIAAV
jgi:large subunit ribosomal protein L21